jgi:conjugal transfer pilus assembly protein TraU
MPGIPVGFWEPVRLVDVTRTPYCLVNMGGVCIGNKKGVLGRGDVEEDADDGTHRSFYQVHWYTYPIMTALEVLVDFACLESTSIDLAYVTELDPFWDDDEKSAILNPDGIIFGNILAQAACVADCVAATAHLPIDKLFWCGGCQGSLYPFTGTITEHMGGVQASLLLVQRIIAKLHRQFILWSTSGKESICEKQLAPLIKKTQYRTQMVYPLVTQRCDPLGHSELMWQAGREYPDQGSDFGYLIWRKRDCCLL